MSEDENLEFEYLVGKELLDAMASGSGVPVPKAKVEEIERKVRKKLGLSENTNSVDPSHYDFPGGVQVKDVSAHLTSFGGQALQYIARSTRLDGMNKGEQVTDLQKAIRLLEWEIERVEGLENE